MSVVIETTLGDITVDLYLEQRPRACINFLKLCKIKYYNFNLFHTISRGFIAQTGDPTGTRTGGESIYGVIDGESKRYFEAESEPRIKHTETGLISFVGGENNIVGSQFFITLGDDLTYLDEKHCVFGKVVEGFDILESINEVICDKDDRPYQDVRISHTVILDDPYPDPDGLVVPSRSPSPSAERLRGGRIAPDEDIDESVGKSAKEVAEMAAEREAKARATILEMIGDIPDAEVAPPENVLFVCKLNPVTTDDDLEIIFSRFGKIKSSEVIRDKKSGDSLQYAFIEFEEQKSCEDAYFKMDNVLIDDRRIHVDFSQSVSKVKWLGKGRIAHFDEKGNKKKNGDQNIGQGNYKLKNNDFQPKPVRNFNRSISRSMSPYRKKREEKSESPSRRNNRKHSSPESPMRNRSSGRRETDRYSKRNSRSPRDRFRRRSRSRSNERSYQSNNRRRYDSKSPNRREITRRRSPARSGGRYLRDSNQLDINSEKNRRGRETRSPKRLATSVKSNSRAGSRDRNRERGTTRSPKRNIERETRSPKKSTVSLNSVSRVNSRDRDTERGTRSLKRNTERETRSPKKSTTSLNSGGREEDGSVRKNKEECVKKNERDGGYRQEREPTRKQRSLSISSEQVNKDQNGSSKNKVSGSGDEEKVREKAGKFEKKKNSEIENDNKNKNGDSERSPRNKKSEIGVVKEKNKKVNKTKKTSKKRESDSSTSSSSESSSSSSDESTEEERKIRKNKKVKQKKLKKQSSSSSSSDSSEEEKIKKRNKKKRVRKSSTSDSSSSGSKEKIAKRSKKNISSKKKSRKVSTSSPSSSGSSSTSSSSESGSSSD